MIVTIVCDVLGEENNGTTIAAMNLIRYLKKQGHIVRILCADQNKKGQENCWVVPNMNFGKTLNKYVEKVGVTLAKPVEDIIRDCIKGSDVVHILIPLYLSMNAIKIAKEYDIPMTASFHMQAENLTSYFKLNNVKFINTAVYKIIYKYVYQYVDKIHFPTKFIEEIFEKNIKKTTPGCVISNGVNDYVKKENIEKPLEYQNKIVILTTGRYAREKSQDTLIKAIYHSKYKDKIQLILGGQGIKEKEYRKLAKNLPVQPLFKFYSRTEIIDVLNYSDIYVHPAEIELEGISCIEAIACGKLTIVSNSKLSATKEFAVDERCIFKCRKPKDLARVIDYWIDHPEEKKIIEDKYLHSALAFNQEKCMEKMEQMLFDAIKVHKNQEK
mgnify:FL=1